jgi:hypothetical protein
MVALSPAAIAGLTVGRLMERADFRRLSVPRLLLSP